MAHPAQQQFCLQVKERSPESFRASHVLEIGARDLNGTVRGLFADSRYVGVDCSAGPGVDVVCLGHEYESEPESFDVVCALETFEHDPYAERTVARMLRLLRPGGLFFSTCAGEGRREHGTRRTGRRYGPQADFYRNVSLWQFCEWLRRTETKLSELHVRHNRAVCDLYCYAIKA